ncbi:MAG: hypothetical protein JXB30_03110, partial [Anaerolineae bacterium]|nr:hypothetical protein [Anaerolineae bacterium]
FVDDFREWKWSSYASHLSQQPTRLNRAEVLEWFGVPEDYIELHAQWITEAESQWFVADDDEILYHAG